MNILHLATDNKFIDQAWRSFERVFPGCNHLYLLAEGEAVYVSTGADQVAGRSYWRHASSAEMYRGQDIVIVHSLHPDWCPAITRVPRGIPVVWLGWGYDYYDLIQKAFHCNFLLDSTRVLYERIRPEQGVLVRLKSFIKKLGIWRYSKENVIRRINYFSPVLPAEYDLVRNACQNMPFPDYLRWNYGTLEDDLIKGFQGRWVKGESVLVGNSATFSNNHLEVLELLSDALDADRAILLPLSYGESDYAEAIIAKGLALFGNRMTALTTFMPVESYIDKLLQCGYVVMNHVRQQAVGNIVIMLYLGAKVFLREENPVYHFFKNLGARIYTLEDLKNDPDMLNQPLSVEARQCNREVVTAEWCRANADEKTRNLVLAALARPVQEPPE